jgi:hypothetical protein
LASSSRQSRTRCRGGGGATFSTVIAREGGRSSTPRTIDLIIAVSEYWIARSSRAMTVVVRMVLEKIGLTNDGRSITPDGRHN